MDEPGGVSVLATEPILMMLPPVAGKTLSQVLNGSRKGFRRKVTPGGIYGEAFPASVPEALEVPAASLK